MNSPRLDLINKNNVKNLEIAWIYRSGEPQDIQCNPVVIDGDYLYSNFWKLYCSNKWL